MNYEVQIGSVYDMEAQRSYPATKFTISEDEYELLVRFADVRRDDELNALYVINNCSFKMVPIL